MVLVVTLAVVIVMAVVVVAVEFKRFILPLMYLDRMNYVESNNAILLEDVE